MPIRHIILLFILTTYFSCYAQAALEMPGIFQQHMVLQREMRIPVWGWAKANAKVHVFLNGKSVTTIADNTGEWKTFLPKMKAGGPYKITVTSAEETIIIDDVLIGQVWLTSGQSNMEMGVKAAANGTEEVAAANYPKIRLFFTGGSIDDEPQRKLENSNWWVCGSETVGYFSAIGYFFARQIHLAKNVPVGIINVSWSGTRIEGWIPRSGFQSDEQLQPMLEQIKTPLNPNMPTAIYNSRINPLVPFALRGVLWYQGESNVMQANQYQRLLMALINGWRNIWGEGDFPFLIVQLPNYQTIREQPEESMWAELREAQSKATVLPNTYIAVTTDIGDANNIHPENKQEVARRLSLIALAQCYGSKQAYSGPKYQSIKSQGAEIVISYARAGGKLLVPGGAPLLGFAIAGPNGVFHWAKAVINNNTVSTSCPEVPIPCQIRYNWADNPVGNLTNETGLPAAPFCANL